MNRTASNTRRWTVLGLIAGLALALGSARAETPARNETLLKLAPNAWTKIHEQKKGEGLTFERQAHGGSCFDTKRGRLILFGSNTHGRDWKNSPFFFDPVGLKWTAAYPEDPRATYRVSDEGIPVAGEKGDRPWATHTFGALDYDEKRDEMVVFCHPGHMVPGRFTNSVKDLWPRIKRHPTWTFNCETNAWTALPCKAESFFPNCGAYDRDRGVMIGFRPRGIFELGGEPRAWKQVSKKPLFEGWGHDNCAYDAKQKALVAFGANANSNDIAAYWPATGEAKVMPTPGARPPKDQHNPMAFHPGIGKTVVLVDRTQKKDGAGADTTETWLYDLGADAWTQAQEATLPFACGMNFTMEYDPGHDVLLLVTGAPTRVWALKLKP